ncbi:uncharacterized protein TNCT_321911 [Trichonephila clavata]|uniref:Uncharacterized protein n=1 Tax=Trichonephila clavata TaxID=2740835 RepID=A0A8X6LQ77_TRICU|nr:uncharacterized protein TNCT_321911 [Trichonephila clavata]
MPQLVSEKKSLENKIQFLEGKTHELLPCPIANCRHHIRYKAIKRPAEPIIRPSTLEASISKKSKTKDNVFSYPKKPAKSVPVEIGINQLKTKNSFAALNTAETDAEDVTPVPSKIKPIMMRMSASYNLILQELHRTYPTAVNTHINGFIKIAAETEDDHRAITSFLTTKNMQYYPRKGKSNTQKSNKTRNESQQAAQALIIPGLSYAKVTTGKENHQLAARESTSSASENNQSTPKINPNPEALNATQNNTEEFGYLQALFEIKKIFELFPGLLSEMKKSYYCNNPQDKLNHLLKGVCSSLSNITVNNV